MTANIVSIKAGIFGGFFSIFPMLSKNSDEMRMFHYFFGSTALHPMYLQTEY